MAEKGAHLVKSLFKLGMMVTVNQTIDQDTAELLFRNSATPSQRVSARDVDIDRSSEDVDLEETLRPRPPVVTIMGHVDHGKTSLLDAMRGTNVAEGEAGGITQHIGAYQVKTKGGDKITFLDTPGHEAFTEMRAPRRQGNRYGRAGGRGRRRRHAADDRGDQPHQAAGVPMIVAINKIDKPEANAQKIPSACSSTKSGRDDVRRRAGRRGLRSRPARARRPAREDMLQAEVLELKANPERPAEATVIEAKLDKGRGPVATVLVHRGTLKRGDVFVVGAECGRVRAIVDDQGKQIKEAGPRCRSRSRPGRRARRGRDADRGRERAARPRSRRNIVRKRRPTSAPRTAPASLERCSPPQAT